jgi:glycine hydroxymethyltransferase
MREAEMAIIAGLLVDVLQNIADESLIATTRAKVSELCDSFPMYQD